MLVVVILLVFVFICLLVLVIYCGCLIAGCVARLPMVVFIVGDDACWCCYVCVVLCWVYVVLFECAVLCLDLVWWLRSVLGV